MHLVVLYGYQGADADPEQLALTDQLSDAVLGELSVVARGRPCMMVGDFNVEPTNIPCLAKGILAGLWVDQEVSWALATGRQPASTCMRGWGSGGGKRRDFMVGCPLAAAAVLSCTVQADRVDCSSSCCSDPFLTMTAGLVGSLSRFGFLLSGLLLGCLLLIRVGGLSLLRSTGLGRSMMIVCSSCLGRILFF